MLFTPQELLCLAIYRTSATLLYSSVQIHDTSTTLRSNAHASYCTGATLRSKVLLFL